MNWNKSFLITALLGGITLVAPSCSSDEPDTGKSVIVDPTVPATAFDNWLEQSIRKPYNIEVKYVLNDNETDMDYYLTPAQEEKSIQFAHLLRYLCLEAYDQVTGSTAFVRDQFPKIVQLIGSPSYNKNGTVSLGSAEGGRRMNIYNVNALDVQDIETLNSLYFHTMHHEFGHIQNQNKPFPIDFGQLTRTDYVASTWSTAWDPNNTGLTDMATRFVTKEVQDLWKLRNQIRAIEEVEESQRTPRQKINLAKLQKQWETAMANATKKEALRRADYLNNLRLLEKLDGKRYNALQKGFITPYASMNEDEDFVEIQSTFITEQPETWDMLVIAAGDKGGAILKQKLKIVTDYLKQEWGVDLVQLRTEVLKRQVELSSQDLNTLTTTN